METEFIVPPAATGRLSEAGIVCHAVLHALSLPAFLHCRGNLLCANAALARLLGYSEAQLLGRTPGQLVGSELHETMASFGIHCLKNDPEPAATKMTLRTSSGDDRFVELTSRRITIAERLMVLSTCQDLSDIRHVQTSLLNMSQVLNQIFDSESVATFVVDAEHRVTHWTRACEQLTGRDWWDMQGIAEKVMPWQAEV